MAANDMAAPRAWQSVVESVTDSAPPDPHFKARHGRRRLEDWLEGRDVPPFAHAFGMRLTGLGPGTVEYEMPLSPWFRTHAGGVPEAVLAYLVDAPLGAAILASIAPGRAITTSQLSIDYLRPVPPGCHAVTVQAQVEHLGRSTAVSTGCVRAQGAVVARVSTRCVVFDVPAPTHPDAEDASRPPALVEAPLCGALQMTDLDIAARAGAELLQGVLDGGVAPSPFQKLTGVRPVEVGDRVVLEMPAASWYRSPGPHLYGGATFMLADAAAAAAVQATLPPGVVHTPLDLVAHFVRPIHGDGEAVRAEARVLHRGRSLAVADVSIVTAEGRVAALARGSSRILDAAASALHPESHAAGDPP